MPIALIASNTRNVDSSIVKWREQSREYGVDMDGIASSLFLGGGVFYVCCFMLFLVVLHSIWDLNSPTRDRIRALYIGNGASTGLPGKSLALHPGFTI